MKLKITTIFDNYALSDEFKTEWGFSCIIEYGNEFILFDTGNDSNILLENMKLLGFDPNDITQIFISHMHWDHVGGLLGFLQINSKVRLFLVASALDDDIKYMKQYVKSIVLIDSITEILPGVFSLGDMPGYLNEQSLLVKVNSGVVVITGCAHPGIDYILDTCQSMFPGETVKLLMGGFHLLHDNQNQVSAHIQYLLQSNIGHISPSHCTGDEAIDAIKNAFGDKYLQGGVGFSTIFDLDEEVL